MKDLRPTPLRGAFVAMNQQRVIGINGGLPWHYSADLKRFKRCTLHSTIIMGRLTWESIGSKPLPKRRNIVVSRSGREHVPNDVECYSSIELALEACGDDDFWIIGGGQIYTASMHYLNFLDITLVPDAINDKEAIYFPEIDLEKWQLLSSMPIEEDPRLINTQYIRT